MAIWCFSRDMKRVRRIVENEIEDEKNGPFERVLTAKHVEYCAPFHMNHL
jgi:hypothetical protein